MISTLQTQYRDDIDSTHNLEMILALHTQYIVHDLGYTQTTHATLLWIFYKRGPRSART